MEIKFLGTGGAFDVEQGNSAAMVFRRDVTFLIDCGYTVYPTLRKKNLAGRIDYLLITHLHDDHVGSLASAILHHHYLLKPPRKARILYPSPGFRDEIRNFLNISLGNLDHYAEFIPLESVSGVKAIETTNRHVEGHTSFAYILSEGEEHVVYSGDIGDPQFLFDQIEGLKLRDPLVFHEVSFRQTDGVHCYYRDLEPHLERYRVYGYHHDPGDAPADNRIPLVSGESQFLV